MPLQYTFGLLSPLIFFYYFFLPSFEQLLQCQFGLFNFGQIWLVFARFGWIFLQLQLSSGCSGFGDVNPPLNLPVAVFENENPLPTDWTFGSDQNRVGVQQFGRVVGL